MTIEILIGFLLVVLCIIIEACAITAVKIIELMKLKYNEPEEKSDPESEIKLSEAKVVYSKNLLEYTKTLIAEITVIEFKKFVDNFEFGKITMSHLKPVITTIAKKTIDAIQFDQIDFANVMFSSEFLEHYIIQVSILNVKRVFEERLNSY